jgi:16S rRNA A1518/A1519 N6-dimethyltransferase RsmA/KsgA/DIM1 with predicted DNA glycosylase/AP lyase activity
MILATILAKLKSLFVKPEPKVETPVVEVQPAEAKKPRKKATKKVTK